MELDLLPILQWRELVRTYPNIHCTFCESSISISGQKLKSGELKDIICIPTSERTKEQALSLGIPLVTLNERSRLDVSIDGADDVDPDLCLVKGGGKRRIHRIVLI